MARDTYSQSKHIFVCKIFLRINLEKNSFVFSWAQKSSIKRSMGDLPSLLQRNVSGGYSQLFLILGAQNRTIDLLIIIVLSMVRRYFEKIKTFCLAISLIWCKHLESPDSGNFIPIYFLAVKGNTLAQIEMSAIHLVGLLRLLGCN